MNRLLLLPLVVLPTAIVLGAFTWPLRYRFEPGQIIETAPGVITGEFHVRKVPLLRFNGASRFIESPGDSSRLGGACLVALPSQVGVTYSGGSVSPTGGGCSTDIECKPPPPNPQEPEKESRMSGYCDKQASQCWVRPGPGDRGTAESAPFCNRSIDLGGHRWHTGPHKANRVLLDTRTVAAAPTVTWRVVACHSVDKACRNWLGDPKNVSVQ